MLSTISSYWNLFTLLLIPAVYSVRTGASTLHNYETRSGLRFAMYTNNDYRQTLGKGADAKYPSVREALQFIYSDIWVECVVRSPLYRCELVAPRKYDNAVTKDKLDLRSTNFERKLDAYLSSIPWFESK
jgi:hypothetical protein